MPRIRAFRAIRPPAELASQVASVPYDVVNRQEARALAEGNPNSFLHVIRPDIDLSDSTNPYSDEIYSTAKRNLQRLLEQQVLVQDDEPGLFLYRQTMNGKSQIGLVCCCHVEDYENNLILKHEHTRPAKEDDRTRHVLETGVHAGPVFLTYRDDAGIDALVANAAQGTPVYDFEAVDGVQHTVWRIEEAVDEFVRQFSQVPQFYVADGHHRAASALRASQARRSGNPSTRDSDAEYDWFLSVLFPASQLQILAYNRVVKSFNGLTKEEFIERLEAIGDLEPNAEATPSSPTNIAFYVDGKWLLLSVPAAEVDSSDPIESLDVALLQRLVLEPIFGISDVRTDSRIDFVGGIRGTQELERLVDSGEWACGISLFPTSINQLMAVADASHVMPPKSTWFEPKLRSGLLVHSLD